jgi:Domain of unknown function (DUF5666)
MKAGLALAAILFLPGLGFSDAVLAQEQQQAPNVMWAPVGSTQDAGGQQRGQREGRGRPIFGTISAMQSDSIEVTGPDGNKLTLKLTSSTEYRKDRQPAKLADFKVGDPVIVRTDQPDGKGTTAIMVASGQFAARTGPAGPGGQAAGPAMFGTLGKDFVIGEVKAIDPPRLTLMRTDHVSQTLELNEDTSLRRGRESVTMADIQAGDHVIARGAVENNVFVPKNLTVLSPEQWKRIEEMMAGAGPGASSAPHAPAAPAAPPNPQNPPEPHH